MTAPDKRLKAGLNSAHYEDYPDKGGYDVYFTQLTYDSIASQYDLYPDIMIGRCSLDDTEQVQNVVHKLPVLINYA